MSTWPQVPAEQRTQSLWCGKCFVSESIGIDEVAEEMGWSEGRCPDCAGPKRKLTLTPLSRTEANAYIREHHRHHKPSVSDIFRVGARIDQSLVGVVVVGRPVARALCDGRTLEVTRLCSDGTRNVCSFLYAAAWRAARALGWHRLVTYTLPQEGGASLRAAGWRLIGEAGGGSWSCPSRPRTDSAPTCVKHRWEAATP